MFAIIQDARLGSTLGVKVLALVDRQITKSTWWTSDNPSIILQYQSRSAAQFAAARLKRNNARVIPAHQALYLISSQARAVSVAQAERDHEYALSIMEDGWDGHKNSF